MGLRERLEQLLGRGEQPERDPDELVELVTVPVFAGDLLVTELDDHGIAASTLESFNVATRSLTDVRIMVRRGDWDAAQSIVVARGAAGGS